MILQFETVNIEIEETDLQILMVGFYAEENYLMIQQSLDIENADYHIERDDQTYGSYGGVERVNLSSNSIEVVLDETGKENLDCDGITVDFETNVENFQLLKEKLQFIFGDKFTAN